MCMGVQVFYAAATRAPCHWLGVTPCLQQPNHVLVILASRCLSISHSPVEVTCWLTVATEVKIPQVLRPLAHLPLAHYTINCAFPIAYA